MGLRWTINGIIKNGEVIAGRIEEEIFGALNLKFISPQERDDAKLSSYKLDSR